MDNLSRTKKNSDLYQKMHSDNEADIKSDRLSAFANRLHEIDSTTFAAMKPENTSVNPLHARKNEYLEPTVKSDKANIASFNNEFLDEFINEVKQYNIKKGLRSDLDTQTNILNEIKKSDTLKETFFQEPLAIKTNQDHSDDISFEMQKMMEQESTDVEDEMETKPISNDQTDTIDNFSLIEETNNLKKIVLEHDDELAVVNDNVSNTNRILNLVLIILFLTLLVALGSLIYFLLTNRGFL